MKGGKNKKFSLYHLIFRKLDVWKFIYKS